jgi:hypothetical protein
MQFHYRFESIRKLESNHLNTIADSYKNNGMGYWDTGIEIVGFFFSNLPAGYASVTKSDLRGKKKNQNQNI